MESWKRRKVDVLSIYLDPLNVRLDYPSDAPQDEIIFDLFKHEKALDLVESVAKAGLLEHELPVVLQRNGDLVVIEGNRRLAALKAIQNPVLVPDYRARIEKLVASIPDRRVLRKISVLEAPSQDDADQLVAALHTGAQRVAWSPTRRAEFFQAKVDAGATLQALIDSYPTVEVRGYVRNAQLMRLFRSANFVDAGMQDFINNKKFPVTTFARLYENSNFLKLARISIDSATEVASVASPFTRFSALVEKIVTDIKTKEISTRTLNSQDSDSYRRYMDSLNEFVSQFAEDPEDTADAARKKRSAGEPSSTRSEATSGQGCKSESGDQGHPTAVASEPARAGAATRSSESNASSSSSSHATSMEEGNEAQAALKENQPSRSKPKKQPIYLKGSENLQVPATWPNAMHQTFDELQRINYRLFPTATLDMLRTVLEKTIKSYADAQGTTIKAYLGKNGQVVPKYEQLGDCLVYLEGTLGDLGQVGLRQVVRKIKSTSVKSWAVTSDHLNAVNHNPHISASPADVEAMWSQVSSLVRFMLTP